MNTSPILAAAPFPSPPTANHGAAADGSDFHQVLEQLRPAAAPGNGSNANPDTPHAGAPLAETTASAHSDAAPAQAVTAAIPDLSTATSSTIAGTNRGANAGSVEAYPLASFNANPQQPSATNVSCGAKAMKENTVGENSVGVTKDTANQDAKKAVVAGTPKAEKARTKSGTAYPITVPIVAPSTPTPDPSAFSSALFMTAKVQQTASPQPSDNVTLEPARIVAPTEVIRGRATTAAAATIGHTTASAISATAPALVPEPTLPAASSATVAPASSAKSRAKPQPVISQGKADSANGSATETADNSATDRRTANARAAARENIVGGGSSANQSMLRSSTELAFSQAASSARTAPQKAPLSSSATPDTQAKGNGISASSDRDTSLSATSAVSAHPSGFQFAAGQPTSTTAAAVALIPDATSGAQTAAQSTAAFAQASPSSAPASTPPEAPVPATPIPHPPPAVDSGQLRVTANNSELKISVQLPELGKVEVRAVTTHDVTTAHLTAFRHDALPVFAAERSGLEQALKSRDVVLGSLNAHAQNSQTQGQSAGQQRQQGSASAHSSDGMASNVAAATITTTTEASNAGFLPDYSSISVRA